jgi:translation initiation factor IF-1
VVVASMAAAVAIATKSRAFSSSEVRGTRPRFFLGGVPWAGPRGVDAAQQTDLITEKMSEGHIEVEGCVQSVLAGTMFRVELNNKHLVLATISGKMRKRWVRITVGDRVKMEMSPYDLDKARIVWRLG